MKWKMAVSGCGVAMILAFVGSVVAPFALAAQAEMPLEATHLRCEYEVDPLGIDVAKPRFSWELSSTEKGVMQTSYELRVARVRSGADKGKSDLGERQTIVGRVHSGGIRRASAWNRANLLLGCARSR